ncbi:phage portal protein [Henriciella aquimarina]|uniref:phage portal protein n=1 Tax=Henriciella aquimarina TaxID=545261 RepID=UPI000A03D02E|nr:anti-CBASS Acb1 family protein [Henriciella aquimarina]
MGAMTFIGDRLANVLSGLGGLRDKTAANSWGFAELSREQLSNAYRGDGLSRKVVDAPAFDMVREWRAWQADSDQIEAIEKEETRLNIRGKVKQAQILARLYGGAGIVMGVGADDPMEPLDPERVGKDDLRWAHVMHRHELVASTLRTDPEGEWFREPEYYQWTTDSGILYRVHPSRVVRFTGNECPDYQFSPHGWGDSILQSVNEALQNAGAAISGIASLVQEAKVDVFKVPGLMENLATKEYSSRLVQRFETANAIKSIVNGLILDAEEEYEQKQISFSNLPEIIREYLQIVSGVSDIPATRLLGQAPGGLNSDGESALRNYYDRIRAEQTLTLGPTLSRLDEVLIRSALGSRDEAIWYKWNPLWQLDDDQRVKIEKDRSETVSKLSATGLIPSAVLAKAVRNVLIESGEWPGIEAAYEEFGEESPDFDPNAGDPNNPDPDAPVDPDDPEADPTQTADAEPRTLYVHRKVLNAGEIVKWAKEQGFEKPLAADDMHVTIMHSKTPVDWMKASDTFLQERDGKLIVPAGGPRIVEPLGDKGAVVLHFASSELSWRHEDIKRKTGAEWSFPSFEPHISIVYEGAGDMDLSKVKPFTGRIELGPEIFEEFVDSWRPNTKDALPRDARGRFVKRS